MNEHDLEDRLRDLTDRMDSPAVAIDDDLGRGRRHRTVRRRTAIGGAALATVAVVGLGAAVAPTLMSDPDKPSGATGPSEQAGFAGGGGPTPSGPEVTPPVAEGQTVIPLSTVENGGTKPPPSAVDDTPADRQLLRGLRVAVSGHLDPAGDHISQAEVDSSANGGSSTEFAVSSITQSLRWTNPGEDGLGMVTVTVSNGFGVDCGGAGAQAPSTICSETDLAGTEVTEVEDTSTQTTTYYHRRAGGYVTGIALQNLYGNETSTPVSGIDVSDEQLAAVLTDPALDLPGHPAAVTPYVLHGTVLRDVARDVLGADEVSGESWSGDLAGYWSGTMSGSELSLNDGRGNTTIDGPCDQAYATLCVTRETEAGTVRIDYRRNAAGGGYDVTLDGAHRAIWLYVTDVDGLPVDEAIRLVTDPRLQG